MVPLDADSLVIGQTTKFALSEAFPSLFQFGPYGVAVAVVMTVLQSLIGGSAPKRVTIVQDVGSADVSPTGALVMTGNYGEFAQWVTNIFNTYIKVIKYLSDGLIDYSSLTLSLYFNKDNYGYWLLQITTSYGTYDYGLEDWGLASAFDPTATFYMILRDAIVNDSSDIPALVRNILNDSTLDDKTAINNAIAERQTELTAKAADLATLNAELTDMSNRYATITSLQNADLYAQEQQYIQEQAAIVQAAADTVAQTIAQAQQVATQANVAQVQKTAATVLPVGLLLMMVA